MAGPTYQTNVKEYHDVPQRRMNKGENTMLVSKLPSAQKLETKQRRALRFYLEDNLSISYACRKGGVHQSFALSAAWQACCDDWQAGRQIVPRSKKQTAPVNDPDLERFLLEIENRR
jgi:hypothetical protein